MEKYDAALRNNKKRNKKFLQEFEAWLKEKKLAPKTINKHIGNMSFYLNSFLNYYDIVKMEDGINEVYSFLNDWFIHKCMWASETSIKENASSIKKFYQCMSEKGYISEENYKDLCYELKENMDIFLDSLREFDSGLYNYN